MTADRTTPSRPEAAPYRSDETVTLWHGDSLTVLRGLASGSVDCCVTSPPYFGLRDYGSEGQMGLEASPAEYVENMRALFAEVRRVLTNDGTLWLNLGDSYSSKNLLGIPWRVAFSLQDDGWILRNDIIWAKPNAMPESVTDRLSTRHEHLFMLSKSRDYWFDLDPIREPTDYVGRTWSDRKELGAPARRGMTPQSGEVSGFTPNSAGRNPGDVWTIPTQPFAESHFAVMPLTLAERAVQAGCKPGGVVLDPFSGSGTTGLAAARHGRRYVGIDLSSEYLDLSLRTRLAQPDMFGGAA